MQEGMRHWEGRKRQCDWHGEQEEGRKQGAGQAAPASLGPVSSHAHPCRRRTGFFFILNFKRVHSVFKQEGVVVRFISLFKVMAAAVCRWNWCPARVTPGRGV